jgi:ATP-dependent RNA helicase DeaD
MNKFKGLGLSEKLLETLGELGFESPSEIQEKTIPLILNGKDVIGLAATGSGKTLAFSSGIVEKVIPGKGIQALVLTPTRELADQITKVIKIFSRKFSLNIQEIYGGVGFSDQIEGADNSEIIVATPGRLLDHLKKGNFDLSRIKILVLDEADRMVDMGFLQDVKRIIEQCPEKRQTLLFSATSSPEIENISTKYMHNSVEISVERYVDSSKLKQVYYDVPSHLKFSLLVHFLKNEKSGIIMVFCNTRRNADLVDRNLRKHGIFSHVIHGGLEQKKRIRIIEKFHSNDADILVCTDVAARGLDIKNVTHVYNYDVPKTSDDYIHRIGRTARAGKEGMAVSLVSSRDYDNFRNVLRNESLNIIRDEIPFVEELELDLGSRRNTGRRDYHNDRRHDRPSHHGPRRSFRRSRDGETRSDNRHSRYSHGRHSSNNRSFRHSTRYSQR